MRDLVNVCLRCRARLPVPPSIAPARVAIASYSTSYQNATRETRSDGRPGTWAGHAQKGHTHKRRIPPTASASTNDALGSIEIFMNVVKEQSKGVEPLAESTGAVADSSTLLQDVGMLQSMLLDRGNTTAACFALFESKIYPFIHKPGAEVPRSIRDKVGRTMLERLTKEKASDMESRDLPTVTRIGQLSLDMGLLQPQVWARLTLKLLDHICAMNTSPDDYTSIESYETEMARREDLLHDLFGAWQILNVQRFTALRVGSAATAANQVGPPSLSEAMKIQLSSKKIPRNPLGVLFPHYSADKLNEVSSAAIGTYVLLTDPTHSKRAVRQKASPFLNAIARILSIVRPSQEQLPALFGTHSHLARYVSSRWPAVEEQIFEVAKGPTFQRHPVRSANIHQQVGEAWRSGNVQAAQRAFDDFYGPGPRDRDKKLELARNAELFNYFIMVYMAMRKPKLAIDVWNSMTLVGIQPTLKTWNAMMDGCLRARNPHGFKSVWDRLIRSGVKLDTAIWTARISGLIALGEPNEGLAALVTMAKLWKERSLSKPDTAPVKPSIEPVNAAVAGLLRLGKIDDAKSVLAWAADQGIEPDIYTYNTLLRAVVSQGLAGEVKQILEAMKAQSIEADVVTFTIIMDQVLTGVGQHEPQKQVQIVKDLLREMEAAGARANMMAYAKMIYILLDEGDKAAESVKTVLAHIWGNGLELTSHIYTMLAEHYFSRDPPDVSSVTALLENRRLHDNKFMDRVFWERVIKGYCQVGETERALAIFERINKPGLVITFATRHELLQALIDAGKLETAASLVADSKKLRDTRGMVGDAQDDAQLASDGESGQDHTRFWKHRFWHLAKDHGLFRTDHEKPPTRTADLDS